MSVHNLNAVIFVSQKDGLIFVDHNFTWGNKLSYLASLLQKLQILCPSKITVQYAANYLAHAIISH